MNARGLDVHVEDDSEAIAAVALQGPFSRAVLEAATGESFADLRYFRRRRVRHRRHPRRRVADRLHGRPRVRALGPGRAGGRRLGRPDGRRRRLRDPARRDARPRRRPPGGRAHPPRGRLHVRPARAQPGAELLARGDRARSARGPGRGGLRRQARAGARGCGGRAGAAPRGRRPRLVRHRGAVFRTGSPAGHLAEREPIRRAGVRSARGPGREAHEPRLEPHPEAGDRPGLGAAAPTRRPARSSRWSGPWRAAGVASMRRSWRSPSSTSRASAPDQCTPCVPQSCRPRSGSAWRSRSPLAS